eukprot:GCRY01001531.1.p1 GENE.GCRY01001531.1~~GCRY01001531.1.p1  ORF type:complete len:604 (+),score=134.68 GCRY01001531.1:266-2077(+)
MTEGSEETMEMPARNDIQLKEIVAGGSLGENKVDSKTISDNAVDLERQTNSELNYTIDQLNEAQTLFAKRQRKRLIALILGPLLALPFMFDLLEEGKPEVSHCAGVLIWMAVWWLTEAVPMAVTALLPLVLFPPLGISPTAYIAGKYVSNFSFLFMGTFMIAVAVQRWRLHERLALKVLILMGNNVNLLLLAFIFLAGGLSMWLSNTGTCALLSPVAVQLINSYDKSDAKGHALLSRGIMLAMAYASSVGGAASLTGTGPNLVFSGQIQDLFPDAPSISFAKWMMLGLPFFFIFCFFLWSIFVFRFTRHYKGKCSVNKLRKQYAELGPMSKEEKVVLGVFIVLVFGWFFRDLPSVGGWSKLFEPYKNRVYEWYDPNGNKWESYVNDTTVAIFGCLVLFLWPTSATYRERRRSEMAAKGHMPVLKNEDLTILDWRLVQSQMAWDVVFLFGGGFALASGFTTSGFSTWLGDILADVTEGLPSYVLLYVVCFFCTCLTELASNTATASIVLPVLASMAQALEINPLFLMVPATLSTSLAFFSPIATPVNAIVYSYNYLKISDMAKSGVPFNPLGILTILLCMFLLGSAVYDIDLSVFPDWAVPLSS